MINYNYILKPKRQKISIKIAAAGNDLLIGSLTLKCIIIAPSINAPNIT